MYKQALSLNFLRNRQQLGTHWLENSLPPRSPEKEVGKKGKKMMMVIRLKWMFSLPDIVSSRKASSKKEA